MSSYCVYILHRKDSLREIYKVGVTSNWKERKRYYESFEEICFKTFDLSTKEKGQKVEIILLHVVNKYRVYKSSGTGNLSEGVKLKIEFLIVLINGIIEYVEEGRVDYYIGKKPTVTRLTSNIYRGKYPSSLWIFLLNYISYKLDLMDCDTTDSNYMNIFDDIMDRYKT